MDVAVDFVSVGLDEQTVCVIEGGPEIVDRIAEHCRSMAGQFATERHLPSRTVVFVGLSHSLSVFAYVIGEQPFELSDVMFGPLDLQLWPKEV